MKYIQNYFEPSRLWLIWRASGGDGSSHTRTRRKVAEIIRINNDLDLIEFRYLEETSDFKDALDAGFQGFPAFRIDGRRYRNNVLEAFVRRIPPRKREDFDKYLNMHRLPSNFKGSDMALLGYTGAKLPGDTFELIPDFSEAQLPVEFIIEVAGFRYHGLNIEEITVGESVTFVPEPQNEFDANAIAVYTRGNKIGHVPRPLLGVFHRWLENNQVVASIERVNGKTERPLIYLFVSVS